MTKPAASPAGRQEWFRRLRGPQSPEGARSRPIADRERRDGSGRAPAGLYGDVV